MLTESATIKIKTDGDERDIHVIPLFLKSENEPWDPNEIYDLQETGNNENGDFKQLAEPKTLGKIIINDQKEWRYEGEGELDEAILIQIAEFVLTYEDEQ